MRRCNMLCHCCRRAAGAAPEQPAPAPDPRRLAAAIGDVIDMFLAGQHGNGADDSAADTPGPAAAGVQRAVRDGWRRAFHVLL